MTTFRRSDLEPLEVSSDRMQAEIIALANRGFRYDHNSDAAIDQAITATSQGDTEQAKQLMSLALKRVRQLDVIRRDLGRLLGRAGYPVGVIVACGDVAVKTFSDAKAGILGIVVPPTPVEALMALDAALEGDSDPKISERDEYNEKVAEYSEMIRVSLN